MAKVRVAVFGASGYVAVPNPSTGTLEVTEDGTYDVTNYASVHVVTTADPEQG